MAAAGAWGPRAARGLRSCLYQDFVDERRAFREPLEPREHSRHAAELATTTASGARVALQTAVVSPFFNKGVKRGVATRLVFESQLNPMLTTSLRLSSDRDLELQAHLQASDTVRFTLEAHESTSDRMPASFARIGCDFKDERGFAGVKIDAVNGPTLQAVGGVHIGDVAVGVLGAYDVGLDHSDRLGRMAELSCTSSYKHDDMSALLQITDKGRNVKLSVAQAITPALLVGSEFTYDVRKDLKVVRLRARHELSEKEVVAGSLGSDGVLIGAYEWRTSPHLKTRVSAQMDVRNFDSDTHHLGVSIEMG